MLDPRIILAGQGPDIVGSLSRGMEAGQQANQVRQQNDLAGLYKTQGAGILAGDQGALNAVAGIDPMAALGLKQTQQSMAFDAETMQMRRDQARAAAAEALRTQQAAMTQAEAAQEAQKLKTGLSGAAFFYQKGDKAGYEGFLRQNGLDPAQFAFEAFPAHAAAFEGVLEALEAFKPAVADPLKGAPSGYMFSEPGNPAAGVKPLPGFERTPGVVVQTGDMGTPAPQIGSIPQGFQAVFDPVTGGYRMERIPGGPEDRTASDAAARAGTLQQSNVVMDKISQAKDLLENSTWYNPATGFGAQRAATIGGTNAADYKAITDTIEANIAFDALSAMREASPTGGALGAISERELTLLGATLASLSQAQSAEQAKRHLAELETIYTRIMQKAAAYPNAEQFLGMAAPVTGPQAPPRAEDASLPPSTPRRLRFNPATGDFE